MFNDMKAMHNLGMVSRSDGEDSFKNEISLVNVSWSKNPEHV